MSAFAVVYERSNTLADPGVLERVMERLKHRGPDGSDAALAGRVALGHWHFWTTPEEVGERQPLIIKGLPFKIVLDGRLDNRPELISKLNLTPADGKHLSDAALVLHAYAHWGERCFEHFIGEYALAIFDERCGELICARDALGDRTLFYAFKGTRLTVASEPWAVAAADADSAPELNETAVAHFFALKATEDGQTLFKNVHELLPAHALIVSASGQRSWRYWQPDLSARLRYKTDEEYAEPFRALLEESVRCRMRSATPVGVLMSGGLDSGSVASLAARMTAPQPLTTISYVFDELPECDERQYINAMVERWGIRSIQIPCDDAWPYKDWRYNPNHPEGSVYHLLKERSYHRAYSEGIRVLLTGDYGDNLYVRGNDWLADLVTDGLFLEAGRELSLYVRYAGLRWLLKTGYLQRVARRFINWIPGSRYLQRRHTAPNWLTPFAIGCLSKIKSSYDPALEQHANLLGLVFSQSCSREIYNASRHALELRHPYRDRRLVEFVLALPTYQLYYRGMYKYILRTAMKGILPDMICYRDQPTFLAPFFGRGIEKEKTVLQSYFLDSDVNWRKFVKPDWVLKHWNVKFTADQDGSNALIPWSCVSYEVWRKLSLSLN